MDLANVDKLAKDCKSVKFLLIRQDLFDRTVDAKALTIKDSKRTVRANPNMMTQKNRPRNILLHGRTEFIGYI